MLMFSKVVNSDYIFLVIVQGRMNGLAKQMACRRQWKGCLFFV